MTGLEQPRTVPVVGFLASRGAREIAHPGGTLLAHLQRVHALLETWDARPAVRLAGLCHAFYGTDGFPVVLGDMCRREELAAVIGEEAEEIVHFYACCDRDYSYPHLAEGRFRDRFTGEVLCPPLRARQDFAEITVANELDIVQVNADLRARHGEGLLALFTSWRDLLGPAAQKAVETLLA